MKDVYLIAQARDRVRKRAVKEIAEIGFCPRRVALNELGTGNDHKSPRLKTPSAWRLNRGVDELFEDFAADRLASVTAYGPAVVDGIENFDRLQRLHHENTPNCGHHTSILRKSLEDEACRGHTL